MIFHSIIPFEIVFGENYPFQGEETESEDYRDKPDFRMPVNKDSDYREVHYKGYLVQLMKSQDGYYRIKRLLCTSPRAFLDPDLQPGAIVSDSIAGRNST